MSGFDTLVNVATYLEARGARKRLDGVAADSRAHLDLARRAENAQARVEALRQTMFDARVEAEAFEREAATRPFHALGGLMRLTETTEAIRAEDLSELQDKEYLLKVRRYVAELRANLTARLPEGSVPRFERFLALVTFVAPQTRAYALARAFLDAFPTGGALTLGRSVGARAAVAAGFALVGFIVWGFLTEAVLPALYDAVLWLLFLDYSTYYDLSIAVVGPGLGLWLAYRLLAARRAGYAAGIAGMKALAARVGLDQDTIRALDTAKHAEFVAMRDAATGALRGSPDDLKGPDGRYLDADAALARFEAQLAEIKSLEGEFEAHEAAMAARVIEES